MIHLKRDDQIPARDFNIGCTEYHFGTDNHRVSIWKEHGIYQIAESPNPKWECTSGAPTLKEARTEAKRRLNK